MNIQPEAESINDYHQKLWKEAQATLDKFEIYRDSQINTFNQVERPFLRYLEGIKDSYPEVGPMTEKLDRWVDEGRGLLRGRKSLRGFVQEIRNQAWDQFIRDAQERLEMNFEGVGERESQRRRGRGGEEKMEEEKMEDLTQRRRAAIERANKTLDDMRARWRGRQEEVKVNENEYEMPRRLDVGIYEREYERIGQAIVEKRRELTEQDLSAGILADWNTWLNRIDDWTRRMKAMTEHLRTGGPWEDYYMVLISAFGSEKVTGDPEGSAIEWYDIYVILGELFNPDPLSAENSVVIGGQSYSNWKRRVEQLSTSERKNTLSKYIDLLTDDRTKLLTRLTPSALVALIKRVDLNLNVQAGNIIRNVDVVNRAEPNEGNAEEMYRERVWGYFFAFAQMLIEGFNRNIHLSNLVLQGKKYKSILLEGGKVRYLQSFPHLLYSLDNNLGVTNEEWFVVKMVSSIFQKYVDDYDKDGGIFGDLQIREMKMKVLLQKEVMNRNPDFRLLDRKNIYFTLEFDIFDELPIDVINTPIWRRNLDMRDDTDFLTNASLNDQWIQWMRRIAENPNELKDWLMQKINRRLLTDPQFAQYVNTLELDAFDDPDWNFLFVSRIDLNMRVSYSFMTKFISE